MARFVRAKRHACAGWGTGKIIEVGDTEASVSWFDSPLTDPRVERIAFEHLAPVTLERQTRVYWLDRGADAWRVGRILDADDISATVRFPNLSDCPLPTADLEVRWDRAIEDPSTFLAEQINESPLFAQARTRFARSLIDQRGACSGMSGLISSIIDLEKHQYEVVRRVLQDPVQRYLLADEVGLGKTIEAGVLIRQYVLDAPQDHRVLVIAPPALLVQWRRELRKRFLLGDLLGESLHIMAMDADPRELLEALGGSGMVVIDEAHHLRRDTRLYKTLREAIIAAPRLLLLSATPVLHNERGFLEMLHLLDPHVHRLEDEAAFRQRIEHRQALAESVAGLTPENLLQIEEFIDDLGGRFPDDTLLLEHAETLRNIVVEFPDKSDPAFVNALTRLRAHLTETYRLDRRILRNRRRDLPSLTPHRAGAERVDYSSPTLGHLIQAAEAWRTSAAAAVYGDEDSEYARSLANWFRDLLQAVLTDPALVMALIRSRLEEVESASDGHRWEHDRLAEIRLAAEQCATETARLDALGALVSRQLHGDAKVVVFCSRPEIANAAADSLRGTLSVPIDRHTFQEDPEDDYEEQPWERFLSDPAHRVLVCDASAEEGLNLQGGAKVIVHVDLPLAPNRIEQRLGRVDRFGSGDAIRSYALCCSDDPFAQRWFAYLNEGLRLFDRSVASLQYLIEAEMQRLTQALLLDGVDALGALTTRTGGDKGSAEQELRRIDDQDALDALTLSDDTTRFDALTDVDGDWREVTESVEKWMVGILQIAVEPAAASRSAPFGFGAFRFCFSYGDHGPNTLIPLKRVFSALLGLLDPNARGAHRQLLKTGWYTCRRGSAIGLSAPAEGIRLVRWGEALIERIRELTDLDDRGRSAAMWRHVPDYRLRSENPADTFLRFDFIVETNVAAALDAMGGAADSGLATALSRRGDMALSPFYKTIWLDDELSAVTEPDLVEVLEAPYLKAPSDGSYQDWNINTGRWPLVKELRMPVTENWRQWIPQARAKAEQLLRDETDLDLISQRSIERAQEADEARFAQLRARIHYADPATSDATAALLAKEELVSEALYAAMRKPRITLGTVIAVFVSPHALTRTVSSHG